MSVHSYHDALPGYSAEQVLHDGCGECEHRAQQHDHGLSSMDKFTWRRAWTRAAVWNTAGLPDVAKAEIPVLSMLWSVQIKLENCGLKIGELP